MQQRSGDHWVLPTVLLLFVPYYLNDFANIHVRSWQVWLLIDYLLLKVLPGLYLFWLVRRRLLKPSDLGLRGLPLPAFAVLTLLLGLLCVLIDQNAYRWLAALPGYPAAGGIPAIDDPFWRWFDLTIGLLAVGFFEEVVFRGYLGYLLGRVLTHPLPIVLLSAPVFGLIHWSHGLHTVLVTSLIGALFMAVYLRTRSLAVPVAAHFIVNFVAYSGLVPPGWFQIF